MKIYFVQIPIAGHAFVEVEAENEEAAKKAAFRNVRTVHIGEWEALERFNKGNVCYCPTPWEVEVTEE